MQFELTEKIPLHFNKNLDLLLDTEMIYSLAVTLDDKRYHELCHQLYGRSEFEENFPVDNGDCVLSPTSEFPKTEPDNELAKRAFVVDCALVTDIFWKVMQKVAPEYDAVGWWKIIGHPKKMDEMGKWLATREKENKTDDNEK